MADVEKNDTDGHGPSLWLRAGRIGLSPLAWLFERVGNRFYLGLAAALMLGFGWAIVAGEMRGMQNQAFDLIMKNRFNVPAAHPDVTLVDIDEASLAGMAAEYGRWPWPRSVMAEFIDGLLVGEPRAIVFDITFSDPDVDHPDADAFLSEVVARAPNTFFAMVRLNPANDGVSALRLSRLAGVRRSEAQASPTATVAMIVPYFFDSLAGARLGTINLDAGTDGVTRRYQLYRDVAGWRIGSLPANVVSALGRALPDQPDMLLNWRGPPGSYPVHSFLPLYQSLTDRGGAAAAAKFRDKIVIVGSTAPSLFDLKPTPLARAHPGLEILATALDNLYAGDALRQLSPWWYAVLTVAVLALLAIAFVNNVDYRILNPVFTAVQFAFLAISYLFLNYSSVFVDLSGPFAAAMVYFVIARTYSLGLNLRRNGHQLFSASLDRGSRCRVLLVKCVLPATTRTRRVRALLMRQTGLTQYGVSAPRIFRQSPLLAALFRDTLLIYWLVRPDQTPRALQDLYEMLEDTLTNLDARALQCGFLLDTFDFQVDAEGGWREPGKAALAQMLAGTAATQTQAATGVAASAAFVALSHAHADAAVPERLQNAGLRA